MGEPSNAGKRWFKNEDIALLDEFIYQKLDIQVIANIHKRNIGGIRSRIRHLAWTVGIQEKKMTLEEVAKIFHLDDRDIKRMKSRIEKDKMTEDVSTKHSRVFSLVETSSSSTHNTLLKKEWQKTFISYSNPKKEIEWYVFNRNTVELLQLIKYLHKRNKRDWVIIKDAKKYGTVSSILKNRLEEEDIHDRPWWSQHGILFFLTSPRKSMYKILRDIKEGVLFHHHEPIFLEVERICIFCTYKPTEKEYKNMEVRGMICKEII